MRDPLGRTPLRDAIQQTKDIPCDTAQIGVTVTPGDVGVSGEVHKSLGKGWSAGASGSYMQRAGWWVAGVLGWKGRST